MTNNDDWARFCAMMEKAGWVLTFGNMGVVFFPLEMEELYEPGFGLFQERKIGDWRTWLEAGQTPPPF